MKAYNKSFEKVLIILTIVAVILSVFNISFIPFIFSFPAILFLVRMVQDFRGKNDSQASKNLTTAVIFVIRSEEHTSELQSRFDLVCRLLLEQKKKHLKPISR